MNVSSFSSLAHEASVTRGRAQRGRSPHILSALVFLFVSILYLSPCLSLGSLFFALLPSFPLWGENSSPVSAEKYSRSSKNTMECSHRSWRASWSQADPFYGPRSSKSVLFIQQQVTTKVISWHFPNTAALDIGWTLQSKHVVTVADCVWRSTWNIFSANRLKIWPTRHYNIILIFSIQCNNIKILWNATCYDIYICLFHLFHLYYSATCATKVKFCQICFIKHDNVHLIWVATDLQYGHAKYYALLFFPPLTLKADSKKNALNTAFLNMCSAHYPVNLELKHVQCSFFHESGCGERADKCLKM